MVIEPAKPRQWCFGKLRYLDPETENIVRDGKILCTHDCLAKFERGDPDCHGLQLTLDFRGI